MGVAFPSLHPLKRKAGEAYKERGNTCSEKSSIGAVHVTCQEMVLLLGYLE